MSVFCDYCKQRVIVEDLKVKKYHAVRVFATAGDIDVARAAHVAATTILAQNVTIGGTVRGQITAWDKVVLTRSAWVTGDVTAPRLVVKDGARLAGFYRIGPTDEPEDPEAEQPPVVGRAGSKKRRRRNAQAQGRRE